MYPPKFDYYRASSVDEAVALLREHQGAKLLAGGHSLIPIMKLHFADPGTIIDIGRVAELGGITANNGSVQIGATTTHAAIEHSDVVPAALSQAAGWIGDPMVRNRGTVGGSVSHADPASDLPIVFMALGATFHITGPAAPGQPGHARGAMPLRSRTLAATDFFTGFYSTAMDEGEILTAIEVPAEGAGLGSAYAKMFNPASRFALVGAAAALTIQGGTCTAARVAIGALTPSAQRAPSVEAALVGQALSDELIDTAAAAVAGDLGEDVSGDIHASAAYRRQMAPVYVARALKQAAQRAA